MENLKVEYVNTEELIPYAKNAKAHTDEQIQQIKKSIETFGMLDPIGVWKNNEIVEGHGRLMACKELGIKEVPVIRLEHLTDEERRAYILAHNQLTMNTGWIEDMLAGELDEILNINMEDFGFQIPTNMFEEEEEAEEEKNERERTMDAYNLREFDEYATEGYYQMPVIYPCNYVPEDLIGFNYAKTSQRKDVGIHFYVDDYQFERVWNNPQEYADILAEYACCLTPDFSLYQEMPMAMKIWNVYRSRMIGQILQRNGLKVIPTVSWCEPETFAWCFDGLPRDATLSISTIGVKKNGDNFKIWKDGVDAMIKRLNPKRLLVYGGEVEYDYGKIEVIYYKNHVTDAMAERRE